MPNHKLSKKSILKRSVR